MILSSTNARTAVIGVEAAMSMYVPMVVMHGQDQKIFAASLHSSNRTSSNNR